MLAWDGGSILAIDIGTKTGICHGIPGQEPTLLTMDWHVEKEDEVADRHGEAVKWMARFLRDTPPDVVVIEQIIPLAQKWHASNHQSDLIMLGLNGVFGGLARAKNIPLISAPIFSWRLYAFGPGRAKLKRKEAKAAAKDICDKLGWHYEDDNAADAACIWLWACAHVAPKLVQRTEPLFLRGRTAVLQ